MIFKREIFVKLYNDDSTRITKSGGCIEADEINGVNSLPLTFVPKMPWKTINDKDKEILFNSGKPQTTDVSLIKVPRFLKKEFEKLKISEISTQNEINNLQRTQSYKKLLNQVINYYKKYNDDNIDIIPHSLYFGAPNLSNNTFNRDKNVYIGMHLDSFERSELGDRINARNRICINLGKDSRYLLFYNISLSTMYELVKEDKDVKNNVNMIYKKFALKYQETPIYRLEVKPYEAYIAPTEYIIHDGSSWSSHNPDLNLVLRGKFTFKKNNFFRFLKNFLFLQRNSQ